MKLLNIVSFALLSLMGCSQPSINQKDVERVINYLASDKLRGREVFTPELDSAAKFIEQEFRQIGLDPMNNDGGYRQSFKLISIGVDSSYVSLNQQKINPSDYFMQLDTSMVRWNDKSQILIKTIGPEDDFRREFQSIFQNDDNLIVLVDTAHAKNFSLYRQYLSGPSNRLAIGKGRSLVAILIPAVDPQQFWIYGHAKVEEKPLANVVGKITGKRTNEYVIFSGHYDHLGIRNPVKGDSIANGANDDASGTTAVIELARYFRQLPPPERSLIFVAFTAEETGGYGSKYFSQQLDPDQIIAMFNIEMIGKLSSKGKNTAWITGWDKSDLGEMMARSGEKSGYVFFPDPYPEQNLFYRSDNATLARLGVPAHSISTTQIDIDKDYHQVTDEVSTLDLDHLTNTIKAIAAGASAIISGNQTPSRVDKASVH